MRLTRLDLTRYGKFTETGLAFAPPSQNAPDLHVICGPNEAGKSTFWSAWLDLLFQIPVRSNMNFVHDYKHMQLGAQLEVEGNLLSLIRLKRRDGSLQDTQGKVVPEAQLANALRGLDRDAYSAMFSLNRDTLDQGGAGILASQGDLGELLFQAGAGLTDVAAQLDGMRAEADQFLNATGRKGALKELRQDFDEIEARIKERDVAAPEYARLTKARDEAQEHWEMARKDWEERQAAQVAVGRMQEVLPKLGRLKRLKGQLTDLRDLPEPPQVWLDNLEDTDRLHTTLTTGLERDRRAVVEAKQRLDQIQRDPEVLAVQPQFETAKVLFSAADTALQDLPRRQEALAGLELQIASRLQSLGQGGARPGDILVQTPVRDELRKLIQKRTGLDAAVGVAEEELTAASQGLAELKQRLKAQSGGGADIGGLTKVLASIRAKDPSAALQLARHKHQSRLADLTRALQALAPWQGAVLELTLPDIERLDRLQRQLDENQEELKELERALSQKMREVQSIEQSLTSYHRHDDVSPDQAAEARSLREAAWAAHLSDLTPESAQRFERSMRLDDQTAQGLAERLIRAEQSVDAGRRLTLVQKEQAEVQQTYEHAKAMSETFKEQLRELVTGVSQSFSPDMELGAFRRWIEAAKLAQSGQLALDEARNEEKLALAQLQDATRDLKQAMDIVGCQVPDTSGLVVLIEFAQAHADKAATLNALGERVTEAEVMNARRKQALHLAQRALEEWRVDWQAATQDLWFADRPVAAVASVLDELDVLRGLDEKQRDLEHRVTAMRGDQKKFNSVLDAFADTLGADPVWSELNTRLEVAKSNETLFKAQSDNLQTAQNKLRTTETEAHQHQSLVAEMSLFLGVKGWTDCRDILVKIREQRLLDASIAELEDDICQQLRVDKIDEAQSRMEEVDADSLDARSMALQHELEALHSAREEAHAQFRAAEASLAAVGGDDEIALLMVKRQTLLLEIEERTRRYLQLRMGLRTVDDLMRRYRDTHRSGMLTRASDAFVHLTRGAYSGLVAQPDGARDVLVAMTQDGRSKDADALSEGTRAQLYLALRIAGYHEFVQAHGPVPFVADDIMESFDDDRAQAAFELLSEIAQVGQVIYLTHHTHLCDIARAACAQVNIQQMPA